MYLRHKFRQDLAYQQKHNTKAFLVGGKDRSGVSLYINHQQTPGFYLGICFFLSYCLVLSCPFFFLKEKEGEVKELTLTTLVQMQKSG